MSEQLSAPSALASLSGAHNFRNLAGMNGAGGRRVAANVLYRSAGLHKLHPEGWTALSEHGVRTICDLRGQQESSHSPTTPPPGHRVRILAFDIRNDIRSDPKLMSMLAAKSDAATARHMMLEIYRRFPAAFAPRLHLLFDAATEGGTPTLLHCAAGKDRTGFAVALVLHALGVSMDDIMADYLVSRSALGSADPRIPGLQALFESRTGLPLPVAAALPILTVEPEYLRAAFDAIAHEHGGADTWLQAACGLTPARREHLQEVMLVA
jgi:protein-tyrosine phosphatase